MALKSKKSKFVFFKRKAFACLCFLIFSSFLTPAAAEISENWEIFKDPDLIGISGCFGSTEDSIQYYYNNILHYAFLLKYEDGYFPVAIVNAYHPTGEPVEPDLKYDPSLEALEFMEINGYVSSPKGMWGLYVIDFLEKVGIVELEENRNPEEIISLASQISCPKEVPNEFYGEIFDDANED